MTKPKLREQSYHDLGLAQTHIKSLEAEVKRLRKMLDVCVRTIDTVLKNPCFSEGCPHCEKVLKNLAKEARAALEEQEK